MRAYYNYRRNGYVVSGRYAFSVVSDPVNEGALAQDMEPMEPDNSVEANLPPPIPFAAPPEVVVIPETNVYVVPDIDVDLFFWDGWWWRPWEGRWYRSHYYNRGWGYYNNVPSFYFDVDPGWRGYYRDRNWYGHRWNYERIPNQRLQQNWKSWQNDRHWERQGTWGVQNYQPRPQQQRQELRQQRQQQYQHRPDVQSPQRQRLAAAKETKGNLNKNKIVLLLPPQKSHRLSRRRKARETTYQQRSEVQRPQGEAFGSTGTETTSGSTGTKTATGTETTSGSTGTKTATGTETTSGFNRYRDNLGFNRYRDSPRFSSHNTLSLKRPERGS